MLRWGFMTPFSYHNITQRNRWHKVYLDRVGYLKARHRSIDTIQLLSHVTARKENHKRMGIKFKAGISSKIYNQSSRALHNVLKARE